MATDPELKQQIDAELTSAINELHLTDVYKKYGAGTTYDTTHTGKAEIHIKNAKTSAQLIVGSSPIPTPPPASGAKYSPLALESPITVTLSNANMRAAYNLDRTRDYIIKVAERITAGTMVITGGRNINLIGGEWYTNNSGASSYWDHGAIAIQGGAPGSTVHVEKIAIAGNTLNDAFVFACPDRHIQLQTALIGPNQAFQNYHPDGIQSQGGVASFKADQVTIFTELQAIFLGDHDGPIGPVYLDRVNCVGTPGRYFFWKSKPQASDVYIGPDCYLDGPQETLGTSIGRWVYPNELAEAVYSWSLPTEKAVVSQSGTYVSWSGCPRIQGGFHKGRPPGGDYVTRQMLGLT